MAGTSEKGLEQLLAKVKEGGGNHLVGRAMEPVKRGGQTSTQIVVLTDPPQSYTIVPLGVSDHKDSGHWDDQADKLFSKSRAAPTYFLNRAELMKHVAETKTLSCD